MERSGYWWVYAKCRNQDLGRFAKNGAEKNRAFAAAPPVYYGGRFLPLESYLEVPTFRRLGHRLAI